MKRITGVELSHQKAPLAVRESISLSNEQVESALAELKTKLGEVFIISTCNRLSVYALAEDNSELLKFFRKFGPIDEYLSIFDEGIPAIRHLFSTASGLESQAIGEHEILGQMRSAFLVAQAKGSIGPIFNEFVRKAIYTGKKVRKETAIGQYPVSLASVSYDIIKDVHKDLSKASILVIGTGEMSTLMLKIIEKRGVKSITVASKTLERAKLLASTCGGRAILINNIKEHLQEYDIIIGATHCENHVLSHDDFLPFINSKKTLIDLGLPRNFDTTIKNLDGIKLYDLDDLKSLTWLSMQKRQEEVPRAMNIIEEEIHDFSSWLNTREISPLISAYYDKLGRIQEEELKWALPKLGSLDERQQKIIENLISRVTRRVSGKPIEKLRDFAQNPQTEQNPLDTFKELFNL